MQVLLKKILNRLPALFLVYPLLFVPAAAQQPVDNLTVLNHLAAGVVEDILDRLAPDSSMTVVIRGQNPERAGNWWVENWLLKKLQQRKVTDVFISPETMDSTVVIAFDIVTLGVRYLATDRKNRVQRHSELELAVRVYEDSTGRVKFFDNFAAQQSDTLSIRDAIRLQNRDVSFATAPLPQRQGITKFIEPFLVMAITATVVYLFFQLRSK